MVSRSAGELVAPALFGCYYGNTYRLSVAMSTTSLKLPEDLKQLAVAAAKYQGVTPHAFMVDAIRAAAVAAEKRAVFVSDAVASRTEIRKSGKGYSAAEVHAYVQARARGRVVPKPKAKSWRR